MATGTVKDSERKRKREEERTEARRELRAASSRLALVERACCEADSGDEALLDQRLRAEALESARHGLEDAWGEGRRGAGPVVRPAAAGRGCCGWRGRGWRRCWGACLWRWRGGCAGGAGAAGARARCGWTSRVR